MADKKRKKLKKRVIEWGSIKVEYMSLFILPTYSCKALIVRTVQSPGVTPLNKGGKSAR